MHGGGAVMAEIYYGRSLQNAFQAVAHDLGGMRVMLNVAIGPNDLAVRRRYVRDVAFRERDLVNLADDPAPNPLRARHVLRRTNGLLYEIHLLVQLPLWQYVIKDYPQVGVVTVTRTSKHID